MGWDLIMLGWELKISGWDPIIIEIGFHNGIETCNELRPYSGSCLNFTEMMIAAINVWVTVFMSFLEDVREKSIQLDKNDIKSYEPFEILFSVCRIVSNIDKLIYV